MGMMPPTGGPPPGGPPPPQPKPQAPPQGQQNLQGLIHLIQMLGGKAQGAMGQVGQEAGKELGQAGQVAGDKGQQILAALKHLLSQYPDGPGNSGLNPMNTEVGNAILGGAPKALSGPK